MNAKNTVGQCFCFSVTNMSLDFEGESKHVTNSRNEVLSISVD